MAHGCFYLGFMQRLNEMRTAVPFWIVLHYSTLDFNMQPTFPLWPLTSVSEHRVSCAFNRTNPLDAAHFALEENMPEL